MTAVIKNRIYGLDILRAMAILSVVYGHGYNLVRGYVDEKLYSSMSFDGVSIFFVLSGFLIGGILLKIVNETSFDRKELVNFWIRRWFRTLPNYYLILVLMSINYLFTYKSIPLIFFNYFVFSQNFYKPHPGFFPEAWSLAVEEWFYLLIPVFLFFLLKYFKCNKRKSIILCITTIILLVTLLRVYKAYNYGYMEINMWDLNLRKEVITRLDALMFGVLGAYFKIYNVWFWKRKNSLFMIGLALLMFDKTQGNNLTYLNYFTFTICAIGTLFLLPKLSSIKFGQGIVYRIITFISLISYSMYLLNLSPIQGVFLPFFMWYFCKIFGLLFDRTPLSLISEYFFYWVFTIYFAHIIYRYYEIPMMNLRERFTSDASQKDTKRGQ